MYPHELLEFIEKRNKYLGGDDLAKATSMKENPQLDHIRFNPNNFTYEMWDKFGNYYYFKVMPYEEAKAKQLVKRR